MKEISNVFEEDVFKYFYIKDNGRGCYFRVEDYELEDYLPVKGIYTDEELHDAIYKWADKNLDISKLPCIEDATPAMRILYEQVSMSENNVFFLKEGEDFKDAFGMTQKEFERQVDSDVEKYDLEDVVVKHDSDALYGCYGNLQSCFTEKVEQVNINEEEKYKEETKQPTFKEFLNDFKKLMEEYDKKGLPKKEIMKKMGKLFNPDADRQIER